MWRSLFALTLLILIAPAAFSQVNVYTRSYDNNRTGANLNETTLTPANVNPSNFGKLYSVNTDGQVFAQPLFVSGLTISGGTHDVVFVATMKNSVYAIDAPTGTILWQQNFGTPINPSEVQNDQNISWNGGIGILSTPVIDPATNYMYFVTGNESQVNGSPVYAFNLNAIDITDGSPVHGSPVAINPTYSNADNVTPLVFTPKTHNQRPGLGLANGNVYLAFASHDDIPPYHGWVVAYSTSTLAQTAVYVDANDPNGLGGIWQAGSAPAIDSSGNVYYSTGNGLYGNSPNNIPLTGNSFIKLSPSLQLQDYFTPFNTYTLNSGDQDLGASGLLLVPNTSYMLGGGKQGVLYLVDSNGMGQYNSAQDTVRQEFQAVYGQGTSHIHSGATYFDSDANGPSLFVWGENDMLRQFQFNTTTGMVNPTPLAMSTMSAPVTNNYGSMPGGFTSISASGKTNGIVWASTPFNGDAAHSPIQGVLYAFDADTLQPLWSDKTQDARDEVGWFAKYVPPVVANGRMFVPSFGAITNNSSPSASPSGLGPDGTGQLLAYGLLHTITVSVANANATYGSALPTLSGSVSGVVNGDTGVSVAYSTTATSTSPVGTYPITATVTGSSVGNYYLVNQAGTLTVSQAPLVVNVGSATGAVGAALPSLSGTVSGLVAGDTLGSTVNVTYATTATTNSPAGTYPITATVTGSSAADYAVTVNAGTLTLTAAPSFTLSAPQSQLTVTSGQSANLPLVLTSIGGLTGPVSVSCAGLPQYAACSSTPAVTLIASGTTTANVQIATTTASATPAAAPRQAENRGGGVNHMGRVAGLTALALLALYPFRRRPRWPMLLLAFGLLAGAVGLMGCGSTSNLGTSTPVQNAAPGTYALTLSVTVGSSTQTQKVTLIIQ